MQALSSFEPDLGARCVPKSQIWGRSDPRLQSKRGFFSFKNEILLIAHNGLRPQLYELFRDRFRVAPIERRMDFIGIW